LYVQDPDYSAEYNTFYSRLFGNVDRYCQRVHFLAKEYSPGIDVLEMIDSTDNEHYLGFITLRPILSAPVGASILRPLQKSGHFLLSKDKFEVNIAGKSFSVAGTPFLQQDNAVGACAQASIWMSLRTLRKKDGFAAHNPAEITGLATKYMVNGRTLPNREGLQLPQMIEAVRSAGYAPNLLNLPKPVSKEEGEDNKSFNRKATERIEIIRDILYPYVESELPVILILFGSNGGHAVVIIGHDWDDSPIKLVVAAKDQRFVKAVSWATPFYIHNDNTGPYRKLLDTSNDDYSLNMAHYAIPLFPNGVFMNAQEAEAAAIATIQSSEAILQKHSITPLANAKYVIRTYLLDRSKFRKHVVDGSMSPQIKAYYRKKTLPRRVWITELNHLDEYGNNKGDNTRLGEVIIDPTGDANEQTFLSMHMPGVLFDRDQDTGEVEIYELSDDNNYGRLNRHDTPKC